MRLQEILNENLEWGNGPDKDIFMSLKGLVNKNNGVWKSEKQRWFVMNKLIQSYEKERTRSQAKEFFGVDFDPDAGQVFVSVDAIAKWADYGSRSQVPVRYGFVIDDYGVVSYLKIGNKGNLRDGSQPDPSKTKIEWTRPANADVQHLIPDPEEEEARKKKEFKTKLGMSDGAYIGTEGERISFGEVELVTSKFMDTSTYGYNTHVERYWNMLKNAEGNIIYYTGKELGSNGDKFTLVATVKKHLVSKKGDKVTVVMRPRFKKIEAEIEEGKWDYPDKMKGKDRANSDAGRFNSGKNRAERKQFRKAEKAKAHAARMRGEIE